MNIKIPQISILILLSDTDIMDNLREYLDDFFTLYVASNIHNAKDILINKDIDLILIYENISKLSPHDLIVILKNIKTHIPVIFITGSEAGEFTRDIIFNAGGDDFLCIPDDKSEITEKLLYHTSIKEIYERLKSSETNIKEFIENPAAVCIGMTENYKIIMYNKMAKFFFGYSRFEISKSDLMQLFYPNHIYRESVIGVINTFIESGSMHSEFETEVTAKSGKHIPIRWIIAAKPGENGCQSTILTVGHDVTMRRLLQVEIDNLAVDLKIKNMNLQEIQDQLETKNEELTRLNKMKDDLISIASHDLRTPLTAIIGFAQLLLRSKKEHFSPRAERILQRITKAGEIQLNLIHDIVDLSRLESGIITTHKSICHLDDVIKSCIETVEGMADAKEITMQFSYDPDVDFSLNMDEAKIIQVINNLLTNAIKFTNEKGTISAELTKDDKNFIIRIKDNGIGIPADSLDNIFDKFYKVHSEGTRGEAGTGLGLSICRNLIEMHNGKISVESKVNKGSVFTIKLPHKE